jgi:hypothetical protein
MSLLTLTKSFGNQCPSIWTHDFKPVAKLLHKISIVFVKMVSDVCKSISLSSSMISGHRAISECFRIAKSNLMGLTPAEFAGQ